MIQKIEKELNIDVSSYIKKEEDGIIIQVGVQNPLQKDSFLLKKKIQDYDQIEKEKLECKGNNHTGNRKASKECGNKIGKMCFSCCEQTGNIADHQIGHDTRTCNFINLKFYSFLFRALNTSLVTF